MPMGVETRLSIRDTAGRPPAGLLPPVAELRMLDMAMPPVAVFLEEASPGSWRGLTRLPMAGRWSFVVTVDGEEISFPFSAPANAG